MIRYFDGWMGGWKDGLMNGWMKDGWIYFWLKVSFYWLKYGVG
jgi:hypothetical protein